MSDSVDDLREWYEANARPFLAQHDPNRVLELDQDLDRVLRADRRASEELAICFLGVSGVGKSTLINALVAGQENLLPSGGIGPLTALAMQVKFGQEPRFEAEYQTKGSLWQLVFGLEQVYKRLHPSPVVVPEVLADPELAFDATDISESPASAESGTSDETSTSERFDVLRRQALKLVTDTQDGQTPVPYLLDRLRDVCGQPAIWGTSANADDQLRLERLKSALALAKAEKTFQCGEDGNREHFVRTLEEHASGFLAPLIKTITVYWNSPLLQQGLTLVDLPGVGVAGDVYKAVTRKWITEKARAVVLVLSNRGVTDADAETLRRSDFLTRLLFSVDDPEADPAVLVASVTQLDASAADRYFKDPSRRKREHLADVNIDTAALVKSQVRQQLLKTWSREGKVATAGQERVVDFVVEHFHVFPVSAFEFRRFLKENEDDRAFITDAEQSGVPQMRAGLTAIADTWRVTADQHRQETLRAFAGRAITSLEVIEAQWEQDLRAGVEAESLRRDLEEVIAPMREEFLVSKGEFRGFLRNEVPKQIDALVSEAAQEAGSDIRRYVRGLRDAHWATLKASVKRDGVFLGSRHINLPEDFAQMFVEPIAEVWGTKLLQEIRRRTKTFTDDCVGQLESLVSWCRQQGTRVKPALLEAQVASIKADTRQVNLVGKEAIANLRDDVKNRLKVAIEKPVKRRCQEFIRRGDEIGPGVKLRILDLFEDLAATATSDAKSVAIEILRSGFKNVDKELKDVTKSFEHPLEAATNAIVAAHEDHVKRSDAQKRKDVLAQVKAAIASCPVKHGLESVGV